MGISVHSCTAYGTAMAKCPARADISQDSSSNFDVDDDNFKICVTDWLLLSRLLTWTNVLDSRIDRMPEIKQILLPEGPESIRLTDKYPSWRCSNLPQKTAQSTASSIHQRTCNIIQWASSSTIEARRATLSIYDKQGVHKTEVASTGLW